MRRVVTTPPDLDLPPEGFIISSLDRFPDSFVSGSMVRHSGWGEVTLNDRKNRLKHKSDAYLQTLLRLCYETKPPEFVYRDFLFYTIPGSKREVKIETGIIDIETPTEVIEVKVGKQWKHALGQALAYSVTTNKSPVVALTGTVEQVAIDTIKRLGVKVLTLG